MSPKDNGKVWEREVARALGTVRTGPTGFGDPDVVFAPIGIECKYQARLALRRADLEQAKTNARGRSWALLLREARTGERVAVIPYNMFIEYAKGLDNG